MQSTTFCPAFKTMSALTLHSTRFPKSTGTGNMYRYKMAAKRTGIPIVQNNYSARNLSTGAETRPALGSQATGSARKLVVFGGRGFVGSHVCKEALSSGLHVVGISRSGKPPILNEPWTSDVEWVQGDILEPQTYRDLLEGAAAAISCVGGFGNQEEMLRVNGTANVTAVETAKAAGVPRYVFVSATIPKIPGLGMLVGGYIKGKALAEDAIRLHYPSTGVILRPSVIYGNRVMSSSLTLPLGSVLQPMESLLVKAPKSLMDMPVVGGLFAPPISVAAVARAAIAAATDASVPGGVMDLQGIQQYK